MSDLFDTLDSIQEAFEEVDEELEKMVNDCDPTLKLAVTAWVMKNIVEHAKEGGSFRYLIYDRLGFGPEAYVPLYTAGGMEISNEFDLNIMNDIREVIKENQYDKLKELASLCDEPDCYDEISCGWPSEKGYRRTCGNHYISKDYNT
jgi:hypothetical protein